MKCPPPTVRAPLPRGRPAVTVLLLVAAASVLPWAPAMDFPFSLDDRMGVVENPVVDGSVSLPRIFRSNSWGSPPEFRHTPNYRPLSVTTLAVTRAWAGLRPLAYRAFNGVAMAAVSMLLICLLLRLGQPLLPAVLAVLWFALHPLHVEVAMFAVNREEALAAFFLLAFLGQTLGGSSLVPGPGPDQPPSRWATRLAGAFLLALAATLSKENGVLALGLAVLVPLLWPNPSVPPARRWLPALGAIAALALYLPLRLQALGHLGASFIPLQDNPLASTPMPERLPGALGVLAVAAGLTLWPERLTVDWSGPVMPLARTWGDPLAWAGLGLSVLAVAVFLWSRRRRPVLALGLLVAALGWLPSSHLLFPSSIVFGERLLFFPHVGLAMALSDLLDLGLAPARRRGRMLVPLALATAALVLLGLRTASRAMDHATPERLYASSLAARPGSPRLLVNLGVEWFREGRTARAQAAFQQALALDPEDAEAHLGLGRVLARSGRAREAEAAFREALRIRGYFPVARANLCLLLASQGRDEEALGHCEAACREGVDVSEALAHLETRGQCRTGASPAPEPVRDSPP